MAKAPAAAQNPILLRFNRLMDAFAKSDDERDFYLDKMEGFIVYVDLDKGMQEIEDLEKELLLDHPERYCLIPKMTFYETKKFMEGFVNEKVYDIDTKEKLLDLIQAKEARENFLEFIYDHLTELEKWQQFYQERSRIRIIEWLRSQKIQFVFEEDLDFTRNVLEKLKRYLFDAKAPKDVMAAREVIQAKAKTYYSNEALNPRPKRGRPPKQVAKVEVEAQVTVDMYTTVPAPVKSFLYLPDISSAASITFSSRFKTKEEVLDNLRGSPRAKVDYKLQDLSKRLESLHRLSKTLSDIQEITGSDQEDRMIRSISKKVSASTGELSEDAAPEITKTQLSAAQGILSGKEQVDAEARKKARIVTNIPKKGEK